MKSKITPFLWGNLVMALTFVLGLYIAVRQKVFVEQQGIGSPGVSATPMIVYFLGVVAVLALVLFFIPLSKLRLVFRILFTTMYAWGILVMLYLVWPSHNIYVVYVLAVVGGLSWLFWATIWLHDSLLLLTLAAGGSVFGFFFNSPWTFIIVMLVISVYDLLAVRFGFMVWIADRLSESATLPAFIFPKEFKDWKLSVKAVSVGELAKVSSEKREYSILGGGDIAFPLMLAVSVFFENDLPAAILVGVFSVAGLMVAFLIQAFWLKGKPVPALPPITALSIIGFLLTQVWFV